MAVKKKKLKKSQKLKKTKKVSKRVLVSAKGGSVFSRKKKIIKKVKIVKKKKIVKRVVWKKRKKVKVTKKKAVIKRKNKVLKSKKVSKKTSSISAFPSESLFKAKIKVIGIGGGGGSIVSEIGKSLGKATFVVVDTDSRALKNKSGIKYICFGQELTHGLGTGVNVELAKRAAESAKEKISSIFKDQDIIIFIASLGGGLGSGATQVFAEAAKEFGGITFGIFTMPFKFEGKNKQRIAQKALRSLRKSLNVSLVIPNEKIFKIINTDTPIVNAFSTVNKSLISSLDSLIDLIYNPGIINIDFADLRTILSGVGNTAFLNTIEYHGKNRADSICENILVNPLLQSTKFDAEKILFNIAGADNLSMFEVEKISSHISSLNPKAKIIFGISKNQKLKNKIKTTILMTGGEIKAKLKFQPKADTSFSEKKAKEPKKELVKLTQKFQPKADPSFSGKKAEKTTVANEIKVPLNKIIKKPQVIIAKKGVESSVVKKSRKIIKETLKPIINKKIVAKGDKGIDSLNIVEKKYNSHDLISENQKIEIKETEIAKKGIRRSGLEVKEAEDAEERKRIAQEKEWEIPTFLRKVKSKG